MIPVRYYGLIELVLTFVFVGGFVAHQLWTLRGTGRTDDDPPQDR